MDRTRNHTATAQDAGKRLDRVLRELMPSVSLGRIAKLVRKRRITINGGKARHQQRVEAGDVIQFYEAPMEDSWTKKGKARVMSGRVFRVDEIDFDVLFEDEHLLAVGKPAGLLVHGTLKSGDEVTLIDQVLAYLAQRQVEISDDDANDERDLDEFVRPTPTFQPSLAHRIDRDTSGIVLIAKTLPCLQSLSRMIKKRQVEKRYIGMIKGGLKMQQGEINAPIARRDHAGKSAGRQAVDVGDHHTAGKQAVTRYRVLGQHGTYSLVEFDLITGRTHQIRAHLRHVGSALIGDDEYGDRALNRHARQALGLTRQFLHASQVRLMHPVTEGVEVDVIAPLPDELANAMEKAGFTASCLPAGLQQEFETSIVRLGEGAAGPTDESNP